MARALPPLNWIRAFEAAARHQGFQRAAEELGVSAGAVSQKVKLLETRLGVSLFERHTRGVRLTEAGQRYRDDLSPALDGIAEATDRVLVKAGAPRLSIAALPALAEKWLTPRLRRFQAANPDVSVEVSVAPDLAQLNPSSFDLAVHYESQAKPGMTATPLFRDHMTPVCSLAYGETADLTSPDDLLRCRLLYDTQWPDDWTLWFAAAGMPGDAGRRESGFALYSMAVEAAAEGLGVVMGHGALIARELASGRLTAPFDLYVPVPHGYAVIVPKGNEDRPHVARMAEWLNEEVTESESKPQLTDQICGSS